MHFFPRNNSVDYALIHSILKDLKMGDSESLKEYLKDSDTDASSRAQILIEILQEREQFLWLFDSEDIEAEIFNRVPSFSQNNMHDLRQHFHHARKFKDFKTTDEAYYSEGEKILWNRYFQDLHTLPIDKGSHLYLNLKQYLELSNHEKGLKNPEMISKILFPFYRNLKENSAVPFPFLIETLKIVLILNRKHAPALLEYGYSLKERGALDEYFDLLYQSFDDGVWDKELLLTLFQECAQHSEVKRLTKLSRNLFSQRIPHLDVEFYEKVRELLFWSGLFNEALFYGLKAYSYQAHKQNLLSPLRKIFFALGNLPFGEYCHQTSRNQPEHEMSEVVIVVKPGMDFAGIHYKLQSLDPWSRLEMPFLFLPHQKNPRVELSHLSVSESLIFYPERSGTYELKLDLNLGKLVTRKMEIDPPGNPVTYRFMDYSFETTPEALKRLTPFHFLSSED